MCDCPGLVFPKAFSPKPMQVISGMVKMETLREPYTAIRYIAERIDLPTILGIKLDGSA